MSSIRSNESPANGIRIDTGHLLRQVPALSRIKRGQIGWNEFGAKLILDLQNPAQAARPTDGGGVSEWTAAKQLIHAVLATRDASHDAIRKRLGNPDTVSTPTLLSTLSLWLAGALGISVTVTKPMVAAILFAIAHAGGDWRILLDD